MSPCRAKSPFLDHCVNTIAAWLRCTLHWPADNEAATLTCTWRLNCSIFEYNCSVNDLLYRKCLQTAFRVSNLFWRKKLLNLFLLLLHEVVVTRASVLYVCVISYKTSSRENIIPHPHLVITTQTAASVVRVRQREDRILSPTDSSCVVLRGRTLLRTPTAGMTSRTSLRSHRSVVWLTLTNNKES